MTFEKTPRAPFCAGAMPMILPGGVTRPAVGGRPLVWQDISYIGIADAWDGGANLGAFAPVAVIIGLWFTYQLHSIPI
jgi:hypothetical protein